MERADLDAQHRRLAAKTHGANAQAVRLVAYLLLQCGQFRARVGVVQGAEELLQSLLFKHLMPQSSAEIEQYLNDFSQQAKNLTGPGIGFLLITAILMLRNIEHAFNNIWRARENRSALSSFLLEHFAQLQL